MVDDYWLMIDWWLIDLLLIDGWLMIDWLTTDDWFMIKQLTVWKTIEEMALRICQPFKGL